MVTSYSTANDLYIESLKRLLDSGEDVSPRGMKVRELLNVQLTLEDPLQSIVGLGGRQLNYHFMVGEAMWMLCGMNRADLIEPFNRNIVMALDAGQDHFQGAYGPKIMDQLGYILEILREDPASRQAVLTIWRERPRPTKDVPCTVMMQFMIRRGCLHMHVYMRSNDAWLGLPYDIFNFTLVQQLVAHLLEVNLGMYTHTVGSFHLYERDIHKARVAIGKMVDRVDQPMPRVRSAPLGVMTGGYAEAAITGKTMNVRRWVARWSSALYAHSVEVEPWLTMLHVIGHRFDSSIKTDWDNLFLVGR